MKTIHWTDKYGEHDAYLEGHSKNGYFIKDFAGYVREIKLSQITNIKILDNRKKEG
uniref:Uncharacterized protein n=1 Tax=viral metagenome TaxID=1070528 RepID=A0A6M3L499_9ZZZZ